MSTAGNKRNKREALLMEWFEEGRYALNQLNTMMNARADLKPVSERTIDNDIKRIKGQLESKGHELVNHNGKYRIVEKIGLKHLNNDERLMVPVIENLIKPYSIIPGIKRVIDEIRKEQRIGSTHSAVVSESMAFTSPHIVVNSKIQNLILSLLKFMFNGNACAFNYHDVHGRINGDVLQILFPLQVRENLGRLYLVGIPVKYYNPNVRVESKYVRTFALDCILNLQVQAASEVFDENNQSYTYDYKSLIKELDLNNYFTHAIGVWRPPNGQVKTIKRYFAGWALSHVMACPLHSSQIQLEFYENIELIHLREETNKITNVGLIQLEVYETPELYFRFAAFRDYSWCSSYGFTGPKDENGNPIILNWIY